jgi:hypothetical protein
MIPLLAESIRNCRARLGPAGYVTAGFYVQSRFDRDVERAQIVKQTKEVSDQFGIVSDVLKTAYCFELARQVVGDLANEGLGIECTIPGAPIVIIEAIAAWACMRDCCVDECKTGPAKDQLPRVELRKPGLLRRQAAIGYTFEPSEIFKRRDWPRAEAAPGP